VFQCSHNGKLLAERYLLGEEEKRSEIEIRVMDFLRKRMFKEASIAVSKYESEQVFPRRMGIDWKNRSPNRDVEIMNVLFSSKPKILSSLRDEKLDNLREGASMMFLWGKNKAHEWMPEDFKTDLSFDVDTAARMFLFHAIHKTNLEAYRKNGVVKFVEILPAQDSCDECKKLAKKKYKLNDVPELPHNMCTHKKGCRCTLIPVIL
jgi:hypothetical protein